MGTFQQDPLATPVTTSSFANLRAPRSGPDRWIIAIGVFKLVQAALFLLLGFGAIRLLHKDLVGVTEHFILAMRFNPEGHFVTLVLTNVALIDPHRLRQISAAIFAIAVLDAIEGTGLVLEKAWAEFVTLILSASFLPWEVVEIIRRQSWMHISLTVINFAVVLYLCYFVNERMRERRLRRAGKG